MSHRNFRKEDFIEVDGEYRVEYKLGNVGLGANMIVERINENGEYEVILAEIKRFKDSLYVCWSEPFDGRIIFEKC